MGRILTKKRWRKKEGYRVGPYLRKIKGKWKVVHSKRRG